MLSKPPKKTPKHLSEGVKGLSKTKGFKQAGEFTSPFKEHAPRTAHDAFYKGKGA